MRFLRVTIVVAVVLAAALIYIALNLPGGGKGIGAGAVQLPDIADLEPLLPGPEAYITAPWVDVSPTMDCLKLGDAVGMQEPLRMHAGADSAYAVYRIGRLAPGDRLTKLVSSTSELVYQPLSYQVLAADFKTGNWVILESAHSHARRETEIDWRESMLSPAGWFYFAVRVEAGSLNLDELQVELELTSGPAC